MKGWILRFFVASVFLPALMCSAALADLGYVVIDLGSLSSGSSSYTFAEAVNNFGQVTGTARVGSGQHVFLWQNGKISDLDTLRSNSSTGQSVNNSGQVVGSWYIAQERAFIWQDGKMTDLGTLPGGSNCVALSINDSGWIVGRSQVSGDTNFHLFLRKPGGKPLDLGTVNNGSMSLAAINEKGEAAGNAGTGFGHGFGWLWSSEDGFTVPSIPDVSDFMFLDINNCGFTAGWAKLPSDNRWHPFIWSQDTGPTYLGISASQAYNIRLNNRRAVVGTGENAQGNTFAFLWSQKTGLKDLQTLIDSSTGWRLDSGKGINDRGWIIAQGHKSGTPPNGQQALLLIPADPPENVNLSPESGTLVVGGKRTLISQYSDPNDYRDIAFSYLVLNPTLSPVNSIYIKYDAQTNRLFVRDDADTKWTGGFAPGTNNIIENGRCRLYCAETTVDEFGRDQIVKWTLSVKSPLVDKVCGVWMTVIDNEGARDKWDWMGQFTVRAR